MAYVDCPECGKTMLSIATQCPHCGYQLPPQQLRISIPPPQPRKVRPVLVAVLALVAVAAVVAAYQSWTRSKPAAEAGAAKAPRTTAQAPDQQIVAAPDSVALGGSVPDTQPTAADSTAVATPAPAAAAPTPPLPRPSATLGGDRVRRYASTWVNVRQARSVGAPSVRVLQPGDAVLVDSLVEGWYRVLMDGRPIGYAHRANLGARAP